MGISVFGTLVVVDSYSRENLFYPKLELEHHELDVQTSTHRRDFNISCCVNYNQKTKTRRHDILCSPHHATIIKK